MDGYLHSYVGKTSGCTRGPAESYIIRGPCLCEYDYHQWPSRARISGYELCTISITFQALPR